MLGAYVVACKPRALGMVALVVVGDAVNLDRLDPARSRARPRKSAPRS